jgi:hypothetical protein
MQGWLASKNKTLTEHPSSERWVPRLLRVIISPLQIATAHYINVSTLNIMPLFRTSHEKHLQIKLIKYTVVCNSFPLNHFVTKP